MPFGRRGPFAHNEIVKKHPLHDAVGQSGPNGNKTSMLIQVFETAQQSESMVALPSEIRLSVYHDDMCVVGQSRDGAPILFGDSGVWVSEGVSVADGKRGDFRAVPWWDTREENVIERSAEVMYEIADNHGAIRVQRLHDQSVSPELVASLWFSDTNDLIRVALRIDARYAPKFCHVLLCPLELEPPRVSHEVGLGYGRQENTENPEGLGDSDTDAWRVLQQPKEDGEAAQALNSQPTEEVASRTERAPRGAGYTAKRTHSGTSEDA